MKRRIQEAAIDTSQANELGLALLEQREGYWLYYVLYVPAYYTDLVEESVEELANGFRTAFPVSVLMEADAVVGLITLMENDDPCNKAWEVRFAAARKGFGPLLYDIAMTRSPNHTIMSDREKVSGQAAGVWNKYMDRSDIEKLPLDDIKDPKTPPPEDDCRVFHDPDDKVLNFAFRGAPNTGNVLVKNSRAFISQLLKLAQAEGDKTTKPVDVENAIIEAGNMFFKAKYRSARPRK